MSEVAIKMNLSEVIKILESLALDHFELNKPLIRKIIQQLHIPLSAQERFWDRMKYFLEIL